MRKTTLVQRYGLGLTRALEDEAEFQAVLGELRDMTGLFFSPGELQRFLASPFVAKSKKSQALRDILARAVLRPKTGRFILLLLDKNRLELLPEIVEVLPRLWNDRQGVVTARVASAVPLSEAQKEKLRERMEALEGRPVSLSFVIDPRLIAGLTVTKGHQVYDGSLRGQVEKLRQIIVEG
jgi:F-type H+-transporting ATPase subunit delta